MEWCYFDDEVRALPLPDPLKVKHIYLLIQHDPNIDVEQAFGQIDFVNSVCPCAGLSMLNRAKVGFLKLFTQPIHQLIIFTHSLSSLGEELTRPRTCGWSRLRSKFCRLFGQRSTGARMHPPSTERPTSLWRGSSVLARSMATPSQW